ncbi:retrotransposon protein, putative, ty3-gypsy subclass [Tanacetum coccineum]
MRQRCWLELLKDYDVYIQYHLDKANLVADALSIKNSGIMACPKIQLEIIKNLELMEVELVVRGSEGYIASLKIEPNLILRIKEAQKEDGELWSVVQNMRKGKQKEFRVDDHGVIWYCNRLCVPDDSSLQETVFTKAHNSPFSIHPGSTKIYRDLKQNFWWKGMKHNVARFMAKCLSCQQVKIKHQRMSGLLRPLDILTWNWEKISTDFVTRLPHTFKKNDAIWVVNNLSEVEELVIEGPKTVEVMNKNKAVIAKKKLKEAWLRQKSYADSHQRYLEFKTEDIVFIKVSPCRGVWRFGLKGKLSPRFIGPLEILDLVGEVSYHLALPSQLSHVHNVFHVSLLRGLRAKTEKFVRNVVSHRIALESEPMKNVYLDGSQVKFAIGTLLDGALTWWNSHVQTIGIDKAYEMSWKDLMKLMIEVYYLRNEIQKLESELYNLSVKGTDVAGYTRRFQELSLLYPRMVPEEEDKIERDADNKRKWVDEQEGNHRQQQNKRQEVGRVYVAGTVKCYGCGGKGHTKRYCPGSENQNRDEEARQNLDIVTDKTILDSHCFVHELKKEMNDDLEYVKSLEKEVDELESEKADFSNIYDLLLEECVSKDVTCSYLHSLSDLNAYTELQCMYLHKVKECECLAQKLSKQTESVNKEVHNNLLKSFSKLEKHSISLELALQQYLKAQMQDKNIAISELKKLIENCKGKSVETQFNKPSECVLGGFTEEGYSTLATSKYFIQWSKAKRIRNTADALYNEKQENLKAPFLNVQKTFDRSRSSLVLHQMTSDHNRSELGIHDHSNEPSNSKLVPKSVHIGSKESFITTRVELLFHLQHCKIVMEDNRFTSCIKSPTQNIIVIFARPLLGVILLCIQHDEMRILSSVIFKQPHAVGGIINQSKYALESLKKYGFDSCDPVDTPMVEKSNLDKDKERKAVDPSYYRGMIGTLVYLTTSRPDLQFAICMCARYQARPTEKHLHAVKRIFQYLKGTVNRGQWYLKDYSIVLTSFIDADHAGCQDTRRSTSGIMQFLGDRLVSWSSKRKKSTAISST